MHTLNFCLLFYVFLKPFYARVKYPFCPCGHSDCFLYQITQSLNSLDNKRSNDIKNAYSTIKKIYYMTYLRNSTTYVDSRAECNLAILPKSCDRKPDDHTKPSGLGGQVGSPAKRDRPCPQKSRLGHGCL